MTLESCPASGTLWSSTMPSFIGMGREITTAYIWNRNQCPSNIKTTDLTIFGFLIVIILKKANGVRWYRHVSRWNNDYVLVGLN